ncbi:hypothetical protein RQP46_006723 [Phenoliferia psychrophenolica]
MKEETEHIEQEKGSDSASAEFADDDAVEVGLRTWMAVFAGCMFPFTGFYIALIGASFTSYVTADLGENSKITWLPNAYELVVFAMAAFLCSIGDVYGRREILLSGLVLCVVGCIVIATATSMNLVIVGSALTAGLFANQGNFYTIPAEVLPKRYRGMGATLGAASGGVGAIVAILLEGAFIRDYPGRGWRYGFYVGAGFTTLTGVALYFFYTPVHKPTKTLTYVLTHDIDVVGTALQTGFAIPFLIGLNWGGSAYEWSSPQCLATLSIGGASFIGLIIHQVFIKKDGLFHHDLFECRNFAISWIGLFIEGIIFLVFLLFYPVMTGVLYETRPFNQSLRVLPFWAAFAVTAPLVGIYSRKTQDLKYPLIIGFTLVTIAAAVLSTCTPSSGKLAIGIAALAGVGFSTPLALFNATAQLAVPKRLLGLATGQFIAARAFGASVGAVIFVTILQTKAKVLLPTGVVAAALKAGLPAASLPAFVGGLLTGNATLLAEAKGTTPAILAAAGAAVKEAFGWYASIPFCAIAVAMCCYLDSAAIKRQMNWVVDNPVETIHHARKNLPTGSHAWDSV